MNILIFGKDGQLGKAFNAVFAQKTEQRYQIHYVGRAECDLANADAISALVNQIKPDLIINAAAYTAVDKAQQEHESALAINATAPYVMAQYCAQHGANFVHYSTDYVFDGSKEGWYVETDATNPLGVYGQSKLSGEALIADAFSKHANGVGRYGILRTSWVYGEGNNFIRTMLRLASERSTLRVIDDQYGVPTSASFLAQIGVQIALSNASDLASANPPSGVPSGIYHCVPSGQTTWYGLASRVITAAHALGMPLMCPASAIEAIPASAYPLPAPRPQNSKMDTGKLCKALGIDELPHWQESVDHYVEQYVKQSLQ
jgi:dTDP-4-dehydrorhamnose reductase